MARRRAGRLSAAPESAGPGARAAAAPGPRVALYWAPAPAHPLWRAGCEWLGRDAETGAAVRQPAIEGLGALTAEPRRYGFHATLRPPMRLATGYEEFVAAAARIAAAHAGFALPALTVSAVGGFVALTETAACPALRALCDACVRQTDRHRLPPDAAERARRAAPGLSAAEAGLLERWGYPYVFEAWRFHLTLTGRLGAGEMARILPLARAHFAAALCAPLRVEAVSVFTQARADRVTPFLVAERFGLGGGVKEGEGAALDPLGP